MATQTLHYHLTKPASADRVAIGDINDNSDTIDGYLYQANERADQIADDYNTSPTYNTGDYVRRENYLYKCNTDNTTGTWDSTKWDRVKVMESVETAEDGVDNAFKTMGVMGAKNLNSYPYYHSSGRVNNYVTWTVDSDGILTANGQATGGNSNFCVHNRARSSTDLILPNGKYILSGCPSGGSDLTYEMRIERLINGNVETLAKDYGNGAEFTLNGDDYSSDEVVAQIFCTVKRDCTASNLIFKPMVRRIEDTDDTYQPYAMTNKELTDVVNNVPDTAGTYTLQAVRNADNTITYSWV